VPVGRGKEYLASANRAFDEVIGGWKLSTAVVAYSGFPEVITGGSSNSNSYGSNRVNQYLPLGIAGRSNENWFGASPTALPCKVAGATLNANGVPCAFGVPAVNTFGTSPNGAIRGPGYLNVDMAVSTTNCLATSLSRALARKSATSSSPRSTPSRSLAA